MSLHFQITGYNIVTDVSLIKGIIYLLLRKIELLIDGSKLFEISKLKNFI